MSELTPIIKESFTNYAGAVLQSRALVDVRDCLKPSARQIFYCLYTDKFLHNKPFKKTLKAIGSAMRVYIHGDSSCEGIIMRAGQPFAMRYPLVEVEGSYGNLMESGNWAAPRYTSARLSQLSEYLFKDIEKDTIAEWRDNYDDTEQYPSVLPIKGFYNIVNGSFGIGIGMSSSIPQFNLREVNAALIKLLWNPETDFEDIVCLPDFATGGYLLNKDEVIQSLKLGGGKSCKIRSQVEYDAADRCFIVTEIPYGIYTNTICKELESICESEDNPGIERFNDLTGSTPLIKIYINKNANMNKVLSYLYKNTSLQSYYTINMTMLNNGKFPRVFGWKEALTSYLDHQKVVYQRGFQFDLNKIEARIHIIEGILIVLARIEEVIEVIKKSTSTQNASLNLQKTFLLDEIQAKAVLEIKLAKLAHLEVEKYKSELKELLTEKERILSILNDEVLFNKEIEKDLLYVSSKFSDERRTKLLNLQETPEEEIIEKKNLLVNFTNFNNLYVTETSTLLLQRRQNATQKIKLEKNEIILDSFIADNTDVMLLFSNFGKIYNYNLKNIQNCGIINIESIIKIEKNEHITKVFSSANCENYEYVVFATKKGSIKKSPLKQYITTSNRGSIGIKLKEDDEIVNIFFINDENIGSINSSNNFIMFSSTEINPVGKNAGGVSLMKLGEGEEISYCDIIPKNSTEIVTLTNNGFIKRTPITEFKTTGRTTKGVKIQKVADNSKVKTFIAIKDEQSIVAIDKSSSVRLAVTDISSTSKDASGVKIGKNNKELNFINIFKV